MKAFFYSHDAPRYWASYLTPGVQYEVISQRNDEFFEIKVPCLQRKTSCKVKGCAHLGGGNWTLIS